MPIEKTLLFLVFPCQNKNAYSYNGNLLFFYSNPSFHLKEHFHLFQTLSLLFLSLCYYLLLEIKAWQYNHTQKMEVLPLLEANFYLQCHNLRKIVSFCTALDRKSVV